MTTENNIVEALIIKRLVTDLIQAGWLISVNDGEETVLKNSQDPVKIFEAMFSTDEDYLFIQHSPVGDKSGFVYLVYGNGFDVISDYSLLLGEVIRPISEWLDKLQNNTPEPTPERPYTASSIQSILLALEGK